MINITEQEFYNYLERYANKEISMAQLVKELESDYRTLNKKILGISVTNPDLYYRIITSNPYKQKERRDIDFEALMIYIVKKGITISQAVEIFNVPRRTIQRKVNNIKDTNPNLYELFKICVGKDKKILNDSSIYERIEKLNYRDVVVGEINEEREKFLLDLEKRFNDLVSTGMTKEEAAKEMGYTKSYVIKALNELYRLEIEKNTKKDSSSKSKGFRENLSDMTQYTKQETTGQVASNEPEQEEKNNGR